MKIVCGSWKKTISVKNVDGICVINTRLDQSLVEW